MFDRSMTRWRQFHRILTQIQICQLLEIQSIPLEMCRRTAPQAPAKVATLALGHHEVIHGETLFAWSVLDKRGSSGPKKLVSFK